MAANTWSKDRVPWEFGFLDPPAAWSSQTSIPLLLDATGNPLPPVNGSDIRAFSFIPRHLPATLDPWQIEWYFRQSSLFTYNDMRARQPPHLGRLTPGQKNALNNRRVREARAPNNSRCWSSRYHGRPPKILVRQMESLSQQQLDYNTGWVRIVNGGWHQPGRPQNVVPLDHFLVNGFPHTPSQEIIDALALSNRLNLLAAQHGLGHWSGLPGQFLPAEWGMRVRRAGPQANPTNPAPIVGHVNTPFHHAVPGVLTITLAPPLIGPAPTHTTGPAVGVAAGPCRAPPVNLIPVDATAPATTIRGAAMVQRGGEESTEGTSEEGFGGEEPKEEGSEEEESEDNTSESPLDENAETENTNESKDIDDGNACDLQGMNSVGDERDEDDSIEYDNMQHDLESTSERDNEEIKQDDNGLGEIDAGKSQLYDIVPGRTKSNILECNRPQKRQRSQPDTDGGYYHFLQGEDAEQMGDSIFGHPSDSFGYPESKADSDDDMASTYGPRKQLRHNTPVKSHVLYQEENGQPKKLEKIFATTKKRSYTTHRL